MDRPASATSPASASANALIPAGDGPLFDALGLHPNLLRGIHDMGFIRPTPIQAQAIPAVMQGRDVIGCA
ncbi:MAG: DEAD/DEAH box helicase, partial [Dehalococcoidia bacterium]|nr:DEAD/DEAH box helicase [Dehalococcoidia bacterium]